MVGCDVAVGVDNVLPDGPTDEVDGTKDVEDKMEPGEDRKRVWSLEARESGVDEDTTFVI